MNAPQRIHLVKRTRAGHHNDQWEPWAVKIDGEITDWADAPVKHNGDLDLLEVNGHPYARERKYGERVQDGYWYIGYAYRLQVGYNVLASFTIGKTSPFAPMLKHPTPDRTEAETMARKLVTKNRSACGTKVEAHVVRQEGDEYSDPVAVCSGSLFTRQDAAKAMLSGEWLPFTWTEEESNDKAGDVPTSPASRSNPPQGEQEPTQEQDTTEPEESQELPDIILTVEYHGTGAAITPTGPYPGATCELVDYKDGRNNRPPDKNVARLRLWLKQKGYEPHNPEWRWLGKKGQSPRHRIEVYRANGNGSPIDNTPIDHGLMAQMHQELMPPRLPDAERLALYKSKALAGEGPFAACRDCPQVQDCPNEWGACDRKAQVAKANNAQRARGTLFTASPAYGISLPG